jgi:hypothetical protein
MRPTHQPLFHLRLLHSGRLTMIDFRVRLRSFQQYLGLIKRPFACIGLAPKHQEAAAYTHYQQ